MAKEQTQAEKPPRLKIPAGQPVNPPEKPKAAAPKVAGEKKAGS